LLADLPHKGEGKVALCLLAAGKTTVFAASVFTLSWTHSVEKTRWEEEWRVTPGSQLQIVSARVKGSGAGMEPPEGAVLANGWWVFAPTLLAQAKLSLAASGATASGWQICFGKQCLEVGATAGAPIEIAACKG